MNKKQIIRDIIIFVFVFFVFVYCILVLKSGTPAMKYSDINDAPTPRLNWIFLEQIYSKDFYKTKEAARIGNNIVYFQNRDYGWNKDINMNVPLNILDKIYLKHKKDLWCSTIDNYATVAEIDFLSKLYNATRQEKYKNAAVKGLIYLLGIQYDNGGFPQKICSKNYKYQNQITYNDRAMINVMELFKKIIDNNEQYNFVDSKMRDKIRQSYEKGLECILKTQLKSGMWGAQYDRNYLIPCYGRKYEPPSIDTRESAEIVLFLMGIENPSPEIKNAIIKTVNWYNRKAIKNKRLGTFLKDGQYYLHLTDCTKCDPIWARMYDLDKEIPIFSDRKQKIKYDISEIKTERMFSYDWYVDSGNMVLKEFRIWKQKMSGKIK